jgi:hypothetical protein
MSRNVLRCFTCCRTRGRTSGNCRRNQTGRRSASLTTNTYPTTQAEAPLHVSWRFTEQQQALLCSRPRPVAAGASSAVMGGRGHSHLHRGMLGVCWSCCFGLHCRSSRPYLKHRRWPESDANLSYARDHDLIGVLLQILCYQAAVVATWIKRATGHLQPLGYHRLHDLFIYVIWPKGHSRGCWLRLAGLLLLLITPSPAALDFSSVVSRGLSKQAVRSSAMWRFCALLAVLLLSSCSKQTPAAAQEVMSIGGFITISKQLSAAIAAQGQSSPDLQAVRIQLYSTAGVKVAEGDCSPNGYYFVPVDNAGSYTVRVHGPQGWVFKPQELSIACDSSSCNGGQDVNFEVAGVELSGHLQAGPVATSCRANSPPSFAGVQLVASAKHLAFIKPQRYALPPPWWVAVYQVRYCDVFSRW